MSKDTIIFTPEAIAERIFENWNEKTALFGYTHQYVDLQQGKLYYIALAVDELDDDLREVQYCYEHTEFVKIIKEVGRYDKMGVLSQVDSCKYKDKLAIFDSAAVYLQMKDSKLEEYVLELIEDWLPAKISKNKHLEIRYHQDESGDFNYHEASKNPQMHIYLIPNKNPSNNTKVLDTTFNLDKLLGSL